MNSFIEHDVNEFGKKLFSAIEMTLGSKALEINSLFEISSISYVHCSNCNLRSEKTDLFSDLNLAVNNPLTKERFSRLELSLLNTLKPEVLSGDNCYFCSNCNAKHPAEKGLEYTSFPNILLFNCNRFVFDLNTFQRVKVNDEFEFPMELNMEKFIGKYSEVEKLLRKTQPKLFIEKKKTKVVKKNGKKRKFKKRVRKDKIQEGFQNIHNSKIGKRFKNKKSSKFTKEFLKNRRKKFNKFKKSIKSNPQEENFIVIKDSAKGDFKMISEVNEIQIHVSVKTEQTNNNPSISQMLENEQKISNDRDSKNSKKNGKNSSKKSENNNNKKNINDVIKKSINKNSYCSKKNDEIEKENSKIKIEIKDVKLEKIENVEKVENVEKIEKVENISTPKKSDPQKVESLLDVKNIKENDEKRVSKGGLPSNPVSPPSTPSHPQQQIGKLSPLANNLSIDEEITKNNLKYNLYAIFIHKGTAYAGHYYIYIKSFETNLWYLFDDSQVTEVNLVNVMRDAIGGGMTPANAYMLAYRKAENKEVVKIESKIELENENKIQTGGNTGTMNETLSLGHVESSRTKTDNQNTGWDYKIR